MRRKPKEFLLTKRRVVESISRIDRSPAYQQLSLVQTQKTDHVVVRLLLGLLLLLLSLLLSGSGTTGSSSGSTTGSGGTTTTNVG